jgi:hypothetical protein
MKARDLISFSCHYRRLATEGEKRLGLGCDLANSEPPNAAQYWSCNDHRFGGLLFVSLHPTIRSSLFSHPRLHLSRNPRKSRWWIGMQFLCLARGQNGCEIPLVSRVERRFIAGSSSRSHRINVHSFHVDLRFVRPSFSHFHFRHFVCEAGDATANTIGAGNESHENPWWGRSHG